MSQHIRDLAIEAFRSSAETAYQMGSKLREHVFEISGVEAEVQHFPVFGTTDATVRQSQQDVVPSNLTNKRPKAVLTPRESFDYLDRQDQALTNVDTMRAYGMIHGKAVSRQYDADIISVLGTYDGEAYSRTDPALSANLTYATTSGMFDHGDIAVPRGMLMDEMDDDASEDICLVYPAASFHLLATDVRLASMDYMQGTQAPGVTKTGKFMEIYGVKPIFIGNNARRTGHGALPANTAYMFHKRAIGLATGTVERLGVVAFIEQKRSWMIGAEANAGATRINNGGIVVITLTP